MATYYWYPVGKIDNYQILPSEYQWWVRTPCWEAKVREYIFTLHSVFGRDTSWFDKNRGRSNTHTEMYDYITVQ